MRLTILNYVEKLNSTFEDFNIGTEEARKHHHLLINLVQKFSELPLTLRFILFTPNSLVCYRVIRNKLLVKSSSFFIFQANFDNEDQLNEELQKEGVSFNHPTKLDEINSLHNVFVSVKIQNSTYVFMFTVGKDIKSQLNKYFIEKYLKSPLIKVAKIIDYENKLKGERRRILEQYKSKFKMLEDTRDTLHLVKNKLTPVYTYFELLNRQIEKGNDYSDQLKKLKERIASNLKIIKDNSTPYLERQLNPHDSESQQLIGLKKLYGIIIDSFQEEMESEFVLRIGGTEGINRFAKINLEMLYFLLSEIAMNADEHSIENSVELNFDFRQEELVLTISNRVKNAKNKELILKSFNKEELSLILEKNFNGLTILKKYLLKMGILHFLHIDDNVFKLELKIPTYENIDI